MAIENFTGKNIQDTFQRVVQTDRTNQLADGTGSIFIPISSSHAITASHALFAVSASHEITFEVSSSHAINANTASFAIGYVKNSQTSSFALSTNVVANSATSSFITSIPAGTYSSSLQTLGNITASGDISSSGRGLFNHIKIPQGADSTVASLHFGDTPTDDAGVIYDDGGNLQIGYNDNDILTIHDATPEVQITGNLKLTGTSKGQITASGDISSSGEIIGTINGGTF